MPTPCGCFFIAQHAPLVNRSKWRWLNQKSVAAVWGGNSSCYHPECGKNAFAGIIRTEARSSSRHRSHDEWFRACVLAWVEIIYVKLSSSLSVIIIKLLICSRFICWTFVFVACAFGILTIFAYSGHLKVPFNRSLFSWLNRVILLIILRFTDVNFRKPPSIPTSINY